MAPPKYGDLLQRANDVLLKGLHYGWWRFSCNSKAKNDLQFTTTGESNLNREIIAMFKVKKWFPSQNLVISQRWWSSKDMYTQISMYNKPVEGLIMSLGENYNWDTEKFRTQFKLNYMTDCLNFNCFTAYEDKKPPINAAIVVGYKSFLGGYQTIFDSDETKMVMNNFALGYVDDKFALHGFLNNGSLNPDDADMQQYAFSLWHKTSDIIDTGALIRYRGDKADDAHFEVGIKYKLDDDAFYRVKINHTGQLGVGLQQALYSGMVLYLSTRVNLNKFWEGDHKLGIGLDLNL